MIERNVQLLQRRSIGLRLWTAENVGENTNAPIGDARVVQGDHGQRTAGLQKASAVLDALVADGRVVRQNETLQLRRCRQEFVDENLHAIAGQRVVAQNELRARLSLAPEHTRDDQAHVGVVDAHRREIDRRARVEHIVAIELLLQFDITSAGLVVDDGFVLRRTDDLLFAVDLCNEYSNDARYRRDLTETRSTSADST